MNNVNVKFEVLKKSKKKDKAGQLTLSGEMSVNTIEYITDIVKKEQSKYNTLDIVIQNPTQIDLAGIQLLCSLVSSYKSSNREVKVSLELSKDIESLLNGAGISKIFTNLNNLTTL